MGQHFTFCLLKSLGGSATRREIGTKAREVREECQPGHISAMVCKDLRRLKSWGYVSYDVKSDRYSIVQEFPEPNVV